MSTFQSTADAQLKQDNQNLKNSCHEFLLLKLLLMFLLLMLLPVLLLLLLLLLQIWRKTTKADSGSTVMSALTFAQVDFF